MASGKDNERHDDTRCKVLLSKSKRMGQNKETYAIIDGTRYDVVFNEDDRCGLCAFYNENTGGCNIGGKGLYCSEGFHFEHHKEIIVFAENKQGIHKQSYYAFPNGVEAEDVCRYLSFNKGNALKYICRAGRKPGEDEVKDLTKAIDYLKNEIERLNEAKASVDSAIVRAAMIEKDLDVGKVVTNDYALKGGER